MFRFQVLCIFTCLSTLHAEDLLGEGLWSLISVSECPDFGLTKETIKWDVNKHKLNRTQDGISAHIIISEEVNELYTIYIDICKFVDGGCKPYQVVSDNLVRICDKYAKNHVIEALKMGNFKNEYFPISEGEFSLEDYMVNYCDLPAVCVYGRYEAVAYIIKNIQRVFCVKLVIECKKCDDDEGCCERDIVTI